MEDAMSGKPRLVEPEESVTVTLTQPEVQVLLGALNAVSIQGREARQLVAALEAKLESGTERSNP